MGSAAWAQETGVPEDDTVDEIAGVEVEEVFEDEPGDVIVVRGFAASVQSAVATKRAASSIVEAVSAEDIGKLPDVSIAESLGRLPGLATQRLDGRAQVLTIRGLGPDLSTALLNGREQVSTGDNRGVEFDQYPAELLSEAVVYKTPYAGLIGQGLAGTVDLRTVRPLERSERILSANARYEMNGTDALNPDMDDWGYRITGTYVDQFADDTFGLALGVAYQRTPTQSERFNSWGYPTADNGALVIGGAKPYAQSNELERLGVIGVLEYEPNDALSTAVDLYYSDFQEEQRLRGVELPLFWGGATLSEANVVDGYNESGVFDPVYGVVRNDLNERDAELFSAGWNLAYDLADQWRIQTDISYSNADRSDRNVESYSGTSYNRGAELNEDDDDSNDDDGTRLGFALADDNYTVFNPFDLSYGDTSRFVLTDPQGWGSGNTDPNTGNPLVQAGFINAPNTEDELFQARASIIREFAEDGPLEAIELGFNYGDRRKSRVFEQSFLTLPDGATTFAIPDEALLDDQASLDFLGLDNLVTYDPNYLVENVYVPVSVRLSSVAVPQDWEVEEETFTGWVRADLDAYVGELPLTGNVGLQVVKTDQTSSGFTVESGTNTAGETEIEFIPVSGGDEYTDYLPSVNLILGISEDTQLRLGAARTLARARMDQLNASTSLSVDLTRLASIDPNQAAFSASGGNAQLRPYIADSFDISLEHYFGPSSYVAFAYYLKNLNDYVNPNDAFLFDFVDFVDSQLSPEQAAILGTSLGTVSGPTNRGDGKIRGGEFTLALAGETFYEGLQGFGFLGSVSYNDSSVNLGDSFEEITLPGLSKWTTSATAYFERAGFEARVSHRYRDDFLAEVSGISTTRILREAVSESIVDAQIGYRFEDGPMEGLAITLQGLNLTDEPFVTRDQDAERQVIDFQRFGPTYLFGVAYEF
jgi:iron complex outermembrane receptor protein